jgi:LysM repeat protein
VEDGYRDIGKQRKRRPHVTGSAVNGTNIRIPRKWLHASGGDCRQMQMDAMRILPVILVTLIPFSSVLAQGAAESTKSEALALKAQTVELESLKAEIKAQSEKIDHLTQEVSALSEALKQKSAAGAPKAEPVATPTPAAANPATTTAGVDNPSPADSANIKTHIVAKGETLTQISKQYGVSVEEIEQLNKIGDAKKLQAGQTIRIPVGQTATPTPAP